MLFVSQGFRRADFDEQAGSKVRALSLLDILAPMVVRHHLVTSPSKQRRIHIIVSICIIACIKTKSLTFFYTGVVVVRYLILFHPFRHTDTVVFIK